MNASTLHLRVAIVCDKELTGLIKGWTEELYEKLSEGQPGGLDFKNCCNEKDYNYLNQKVSRAGLEGRQWFDRATKKLTFGERQRVFFSLIRYGEKIEGFQGCWSQLYVRAERAGLPERLSTPAHLNDIVYKVMERYLQDLTKIRNRLHKESYDDISMDEFERSKLQIQWLLDRFGADEKRRERVNRTLLGKGVSSNVPPRKPPSFIGRKTELENLEGLLEKDWHNQLYYAVGGMGKTALVVEALTRYIDKHLNDQQTDLPISMIIWCDFKDAELMEKPYGKMEFRDKDKYISSLRQLLERILRVGTGCNVEDEEEVPSIESLKKRVSSLFACHGGGRKILLVLDNMETIADAKRRDDAQGQEENGLWEIREYLEDICSETSPNYTGVRLLCTSRLKYSGLNGVTTAQYELEKMSESDGPELIRSIWPKGEKDLDRQLETLGEDCLEEISEKRKGNPLYIIWSVKQSDQLEVLLKDVVPDEDSDFLDYLFKRAYEALRPIEQKTLYWIYMVNKNGNKLDRELFKILLSLDASQQGLETCEDPNGVIDNLRERGMASEVGGVLQLDDLVKDYLECHGGSRERWENVLKDYEKLSKEFDESSGIRTLVGLGDKRHEMAEHHKIQCAFAQSTELKFRKAWTGNKRGAKGQTYSGTTPPLSIAEAIYSKMASKEPADQETVGENRKKLERALKPMRQAYEDLSRIAKATSGEGKIDVDIYVCSVLMDMRGKLQELAYVGDGSEPERWQEELRQLLDKYPDWYQVCKENFLDNSDKNDQYTAAAYFILASEERRRNELTQKIRHWRNRGKLTSDGAGKPWWIPSADKDYHEKGEYSALYSAVDKMAKSVEALRRFNEGETRYNRIKAPVDLFPRYIDYQIKVMEIEDEQVLEDLPPHEKIEVAEYKKRDLEELEKDAGKYAEESKGQYLKERRLKNIVRLRLLSAKAHICGEQIQNLFHLCDEVETNEREAWLDEQSSDYNEKLLDIAGKTFEMWKETFPQGVVAKLGETGQVDYKPMRETIRQLMKVGSMWGKSEERWEQNRKMMDLVIEWYLYVVNSDKANADQEEDAQPETTAHGPEDPGTVGLGAENFLMEESQLKHLPLVEAFLRRSECWHKRGGADDGRQAAFLDYQRACVAGRRYQSKILSEREKPDNLKKIEERFKAMQREFKDELAQIPFQISLPVRVSFREQPRGINDGVIYHLADNTTVRVHYDQLPGLEEAKKEWERLACDAVKKGKYSKTDQEKWSGRHVTWEIRQSLNATDPDTVGGLEPILQARFALAIQPYISFKLDGEYTGWNVRQASQADIEKLDDGFFESYRQALRSERDRLAQWQAEQQERREQKARKEPEEQKARKMELLCPFGKVWSCNPVGSRKVASLQVIRYDPETKEVWSDQIPCYDNSENAPRPDGRRMEPYLDFTSHSVVRLEAVCRTEIGDNGEEEEQEVARILSLATEQANAFGELLSDKVVAKKGKITLSNLPGDIVKKLRGEAPAQEGGAGEEIVQAAPPEGDLPRPAAPIMTCGKTEGSRAQGKISNIIPKRIFAYVEGEKDKTGGELSICIQFKTQEEKELRKRLEQKKDYKSITLSYTLRYNWDRNVWNGIDPKWVNDPEQGE